MSGRLISKMPVPKSPYKHTNKLQRSAKKFRAAFADLDSTKYAESMDATRKDY